MHIFGGGSGRMGLFGVAISLGVVLFIASCAAVDRSAAKPEQGATPQTDAPASLEASPANGAVSHAASIISRELDEDPRLASVEVVSGQRITVRWHGPMDAKLEVLLSRFPDVQILVEDSPCPPGQLRDRGSELLASDSAVNMVALSPDGSHLKIMLDSALMDTSDVADLETKYASKVGCPVRVEFGNIVPLDG